MRFVDGIHQPVANLPVSQSWRNYSVESADHIDRGRTDSAGVVVFPIRSLWSPTLFRIVLPLTSFLNVHASRGNFAFLTPACDVIESDKLAMYSHDEPLPEQSVLTYFDRSGIRKAMPPGAMTALPECQAIEEQVRAASPQKQSAQTPKIGGS